MMSVVARATSPARAETPIARPSEKLCRPIATAISMPSVSDARSARPASSDVGTPVPGAAASALPPAMGAGVRRRKQLVLDPGQA